MNQKNECRNLQKNCTVTWSNKAEQNDWVKTQNAEMQKRTYEKTVRENVGESFQITLFLTKYNHEKH